ARVIVRQFLAIILIVVASCERCVAADPPPAVSQGKDGKLAYAADDRGNRVPDFSTCGYMGGGAQVPDIGVRVAVPLIDRDNTARIQVAIDYVASLPADEQCIRGAVLLEKG